MTIPLPHERRIADLERQVSELKQLVFQQQRQPVLTPPVQMARVKTTKTTTYPTGHANTFEIVPVDGSWTRTEGDQTVTDTVRDSVPLGKAHCTNEANVIENTILPAFHLVGDDGKNFWYLLNFATLWRFTLNEAMGATTANEATADLIDLAGTDTTENITVYDRLAIFSSLTDTTAGFCIEQGGEYHVIQAVCP